VCDTRLVFGHHAMHINYAKQTVKVQIDSMSVQMSYLGQSACRILIIT